MDGELLAEKEQLKSFSDVFERVFPKYLAIGMSESSFWDSDPALVKVYVEADEYRLERTNTELWLQGRYVYEAILSSAPVLNAVSKKKRPNPYLTRPYDLTQEKEEKATYENNKAKMEAFAIAFNQRFEKSEDGRDR